MLKERKKKKGQMKGGRGKDNKKMIQDDVALPIFAA